MADQMDEPQEFDEEKQFAQNYFDSFGTKKNINLNLSKKEFRKAEQKLKQEFVKAKNKHKRAKANKNFIKAKNKYERALDNVKEAKKLLASRKTQRPCRDTIINNDDIINLRIELETCLSLGEFLSNT